MKKHWASRDSAAGRWVLGVCLVWMGLCAGAEPGPPGPPGQTQTQTQQVAQAHRAVAWAQIDVRFAQYFSYPDETEFAVASYRVLFDREGRRLRVDRPGYTMLCDGTDVLLVAEALPGRHLKVPLADRFTYERLIEVFPDLSEPVPPALVMLMSESPVKQLSGGHANALTRFVPDHGGDGESIYLRVPVGQGTAQMTLAPQTGLLASMLVEIDPSVLAGTGIDAVRLHYDIKWSKVGKPMDDAAFELDLKQSHEMTTLAAFLSPSGGNAQPNPGAGGGGQGGGVAAGGSLVGMPLPDIALELLGSDKKVKLSELDKGVVVLECFATWSKSSVLDLPALAAFNDWCKEQKHDVKIYPIAVGEQPEHMTKWMDALEKTAKGKIDLPVLLDTSTQAALAMKLPTVPRTLIVVDGRVVEVYGGIKPTFLEDLKKGLPAWLEKVQDDEKKSEKP